LQLKLTEDANDRSEGHNLEVSVKFLLFSLLPSVLWDMKWRCVRR